VLCQALGDDPLIIYPKSLSPVGQSVRLAGRSGVLIGGPAHRSYPLVSSLSVFNSLEADLIGAVVLLSAGIGHGLGSDCRADE